MSSLPYMSHSSPAPTFCQRFAVSYASHRGWASAASIKDAESVGTAAGGLLLARRRSVLGDLQLVLNLVALLVQAATQGPQVGVPGGAAAFQPASAASPQQQALPGVAGSAAGGNGDANAALQAVLASMQQQQQQAASQQAASQQMQVKPCLLLPCCSVSRLSLSLGRICIIHLRPMRFIPPSVKKTTVEWI